MRKHIKKFILFGAAAMILLCGCGKKKADADSVAAAIVDYYTLKYNPEGDYIIFDNENVEDDEKIEFILRYQMSDDEAEQIIANGGFPDANVYVMTVTYYKSDNKAIEESGTEIFIDL